MIHYRYFVFVARLNTTSPLQIYVAMHNPHANCRPSVQLDCACGVRWATPEGIGAGCRPPHTLGAPRLDYVLDELPLVRGK